MRKDQCKFCESRSCYTRIVRTEEPVYDEVACGKHITNLEKHSDFVLGTNNGIIRTHISSFGKQKRGEPCT